MRHHAKAQGFTLLELSVVVAVIALVVGAGLTIFVAGIQASYYNATVARMAEIDKALLDFGVSHSYIPMPSLLTCTAGQPNYGQECYCSNSNSDPSTCTANNSGGLACAICYGGSGSLSNNFFAFGSTEGGIPTRALRLPDTYQYDAWGNRFNYAVNISYTDNPLLNAAGPNGRQLAQSLPPSIQTGGCRFPNYLIGAGQLAILDSTSGTRSSGTAAYVLLSHGQNGNCSWTSNGTLSKADTTTSLFNSFENINCDQTKTPYNFYGCSSSGVPRQVTCNGSNGPPRQHTGIYTTGWSATYVQMLPQNNPARVGSNYDDIVTYKEPWQLQTLGAPMQSVYQTCMYVVSTAVSTNEGFISQYDINGVAQTGGYGGGAQCCNTNGTFAISYYIAFDTSGEPWISDAGNNRVQKLDPTGAWLLTVPTPAQGCPTNTSCSASGANAQFNTPAGVAMDLSGNLWVADSKNNRLQQFNSSTGAWIKTLPSSGCSTSTPACAGSTSNGAFSNPFGMTIDANGNMWIADSNNNRIEELSATGAWLQNIGTAGGGAANGAFSHPYDVKLDPYGNVWVADYNNNRLQEFTASGAWVQTVPATGCQSATVPACPASVTLGQFSNPAGIGFDPNGVLWVADQGNYREQGFLIYGNTSRYQESNPAPSTCTNTSPPACNGGGSQFSPTGITFFR